MKTLVKIKEDYIPHTSIMLVRMTALLLKQKPNNEELYTPVQEFYIDVKKDHAFESEEIVKKLRELADKIEHASQANQS